VVAKGHFNEIKNHPTMLEIMAANDKAHAEPSS
jgi:hypothetical protein